MDSQQDSANGVDGDGQAQHIKDVQKNIRNVTKKLNATAKVVSIMAANPGVSLDDLLASKKINADQKAQALKKPALEANLVQLEEQLAQFRKLDAAHQTRLETELEKLRHSHRTEIDALKATAQARSQPTDQDSRRKDLLTFSQFLRAAAAKRLVESEVDSEESKAFEGVLLLVYGGNNRAVDAVENLLRGSDDHVTSVEGQPLSITYAQVKKSVIEHADTFSDWHPEDDAPPHDDGEKQAGSTVKSTGGTEVDSIQDYQTAAAADAAADAATATDSSRGVGPAVQSSTQDTMANVMGSQATTGVGGVNGTDELDGSLEIVRRPRDETINPHQPARQQQITSWADDAAAEMPIIKTGTKQAGAAAAGPEAPDSASAATGDDGFHRVAHRRGGRGHHEYPRGEHSGRGGRGGRGRGGPGEGRGRGRGGHRGEHHQRSDFHGERRAGPGRGPRGGHQMPTPPTAP